MPTECSIACGWNEVSVLTDYTNENASLSNRLPNQQEANVIAHGIHLAKACSSLVSLDNWVRRHNIDQYIELLGVRQDTWSVYQSVIKDEHFILSAFKKDTSIIPSDLSALSRSSHQNGLPLFSQTLSQAWKYSRTTTISNIHYNLGGRLADIVHMDIALLRAGLSAAGYFQPLDYKQIYETVEQRQANYPKQPIYIFLDNRSFQYVCTVALKQVQRWAEQRVYLVLLNRQLSALLSSAPDISQLCRSVLGITDQQAVYDRGTSPGNLSAVVAAGQVRFNSIYEDIPSVTQTTDGHQCIEYRLGHQLGIRVNPLDEKEDPENSWASQEEGIRGNRLDINHDEW